MRAFSSVTLDTILEYLIAAVAAVFAITIHETCHALAALRLGDDTAKRMGRISLNPLRHIDPIGLILLVVLKFGWAKGVPVNMYRFKNPKLGMALTAAAGPASNVAQAFLGLVGVYALSASAGVRVGGAAYYFLMLFYYVAIINAGLAVLNLIPISPLDGSKILAIFLPQRAYSWLMRYERYGFILLYLLLFAGVLTGVLATLREWLLHVLELGAEPLGRLLAGL